jgi:hypothetical protein
MAEDEALEPVKEAFDTFRKELRQYLTAAAHQRHSHDKFFAAEDFFAEASHRIQRLLRTITRSYDLEEFKRLLAEWEGKEYDDGQRSDPS